MKTNILITAILLFCASSAPCWSQDEQQHRIFPSQKKKQASIEFQATIDSLNAVINALRLEMSETRDEMRKMEEAALEEEKVAIQDTINYTPEVMDSLLSAHYNKIQNEVFQSISEFDPDSVTFRTSVPDSVLIGRLNRMNSYITLPFNYTVKNYMVLYSEKMKEKMAHMIGLSTYYFPIFEETLSKYDMPLELKYMAIIESALNPVARSRAGARGMWQFMYYTAKLYGLRITSFVDERLDVDKAADAAARYMKDSYNIFGDWALAISSYNCGIANVNKAIRRSGGKRDFWSIYPYLPRETRGYVPAFVGAMYAMTYYKEYGIVPEQVAIPSHVDTFNISRNLHFKQINELMGVPLDVIRQLNPQYIHDIVPGNDGVYTIKLPYSYTNAFIDCQDSLYTHKADTLLSQKVLKNIQSGGTGDSSRYKVRNGDTLGAIARRNHCTVAQLKKWNHLRSDFIRVGQVLYIYR